MNEKTIVFIDKEKCSFFEAVKYSFKDCTISSISDNITPPEIEKLATQINKDYSQVIFFDYVYNFNLLLPIISKKLKRKWIVTSSLPAFFDQTAYNLFFQVMEYYERNLLDVVGVVDYDVYLTFKEKYNLKYLKLDIDVKNNSEKEDVIGIIGYDYLNSDNFFNQLSAVTLTDYKKVLVLNEMNVTKQFAKQFDLIIEKEESVYKLMDRSKINLSVGLFSICYPYFLYSMDNDTICLLGNTHLLDDNKYLKDNLVLNSDDSIDEISFKINNVLKNKSDIFKEYKSFRKQYSVDSKKSIEEFLEEKENKN